MAFARWRLTAAVLLFGCLVAFANAGRFLVVSVPALNPDVIISLASHEWERLPEAARLAREHPKAIVLLTMPLHATEHNCHRCRERTAILMQAGVEETRIRLLVHRVTNTRDEAAACRRYAREAGASEIAVVTSPYHTRRALATFRRMFRNTSTRIAVMPAVANSPARPYLWWWAPYDRAYVGYETAGLIYYALRFGIYAW